MVDPTKIIENILEAAKDTVKHVKDTFQGAADETGQVFENTANSIENTYNDIIDITPADINNGAINLNDQIQSFLPKLAMQQYILQEVNGKDTVSTTLMTQCLRHNTASYTLDELNALDPRYPDILRELIRLELATHPIVEGKVIIDLSIAYQQYLTLYEGKDLSNLKEGELNTMIDSTDDFQKPVEERSNSELAQDLTRALGRVVISQKQDGTFILNDYFDFDPQQFPSATNLGLLHYALQTHTSMMLGNLGPEFTSDRNSAIGALFCQEGPNETPTETSIPIEIELGDLTPAPTSMDFQTITDPKAR